MLNIISRISNMKLIILIVSVLYCSCKPITSKYLIKINNTSKQRITVTAGCANYGMSDYPDTMLPNKKPPMEVIEPNDYGYLSHPFRWQQVISELRLDTLSVYFFSDQSIKNESWDTIRHKYLILKRCDLSVKDLEQNNWTITYP